MRPIVGRHVAHHLAGHHVAHHLLVLGVGRVALLNGAVVRLVVSVNALKYMPSGGTVSVSVTSHDELAQLTVADDGPGISPDDVPMVFERFWRGDNARHVTGGGIGLTIVAELGRAHGGTASVDSGRQAGAAFIVTLPQQPGC